MALAGGGAYVLREIGTDKALYTRRGQFTISASGSLVTPDGRHEVLNDNHRPIRIREGLPTQFVIDPGGTIWQSGEAIDTLAIEGSEDYVVYQGYLEGSKIDVEEELLKLRLCLRRHRCKE